MEVSSTDKYEGAFKEAARARCDALAVTAGSLEDSNRKRIADLATKNRLPAIYPPPVFVKRVPSMIDKSTKPADIPVEQPTKFELLINLKTAKALGLTFPPIVLMRADRVIK
jgi:putative tryptophan/tyrosine transport system substrate-binding protein